jgi:hypothetical protein
MAMPGRIPMAGSADSMRITSVYAATYRPGAVLTPAKIKDIGSTWGSWQTWQACDTDNVVCHDLSRARSLLKRALQAVCNFHAPQALYQDLERAQGVRWYQGEFREDCPDIEDIIAMHLAAAQSDVVLLLGFDVTTPGVITDRLEQHRVRNRLGLLRSCIQNNSAVQWVLVDHAAAPDPAFAALPNLTRDSAANVLQLLSQ